MSTVTKTAGTTAARIGVVAVATAAAASIAAGSATADTVINHGTISTSQKVGTATVTATLTDHIVRLSPGMVSLPTTRNAWVSGTVSVKVDGAGADGGGIAAGYVVGCQVDVGAANVTVGGTANSGAGFSSTGGFSLTPSVSARTGGGISLAAGSVGLQMLTYDRATWPKPGDEISPTFTEPSTASKFSGKSGSVTYADQTIGVDGCAGYAQAKFFAKIRAKVGGTQATVILWSRPFTLG